MDIVEQLKRDEGCCLTAYIDTVGKTTIGYGRNLDDKGITEAEATDMLISDVADTQAEVDRELPWAWPMGDARYGVFVNMAFNMGINGLLEFENTLTAARNGLYEEAAREMLDSQWATQVGDRAVRLARQMETGVWQ